MDKSLGRGSNHAKSKSALTSSRLLPLVVMEVSSLDQFRSEY